MVLKPNLTMQVQEELLIMSASLQAWILMHVPEVP